MLDLVGCHASRQLRMGESTEHQVAECVEPFAFPVVTDERGAGQDAQRACLLRAPEVHGELEDRFLRETVDPFRRRGEQARVVHEAGDRLLDRRAEVEPLHRASRHDYRFDGNVVAGIEHERGDHQRVRGRRPARCRERFAHRDHPREAEPGKGIEIQTTAQPVRRARRRVRERALQHARRRQQSP